MSCSKQSHGRSGQIDEGWTNAPYEYLLVVAALLSFLAIIGVI